MTDADPKATISPVRLGYGSQFKFKCHPGVSCFTLCCRGINIILTPYDIIQMKKRIDLSSHDFLAIYTEPHLLEKTDLPMVTLKLLDDDRKSCPFVKDKEGCMIYSDRPSSCRYYPLGVATLQHKEGADDDGFFFFVNEPHCRGFEEDAEWTVADWRADQGVDLRDEINREWTDLVVRKRSFPASIKLTDKAKQLFFMVSYDIDKFRAFVFESAFLERFKVDEKTVETIREDDVELLKFGLTWLKSVLFKQVDPEEQAAMFADPQSAETKS
ncbi:YkgJ family cysteine cluster protein [Desulfosarcina ovata]|uniref:Fe-S oxidoreductase n=1 Tax=Desulfosarcina ovata subsp. ovata TaxID=2752305 RepID=A0A5K8ABJ6_9BACT|nr:YkgJ family cysteine cluster protein [Desulfosarcina ovata]BBO89967.1 Fe-S oxidoreductase [Desulfosarcina ovata subsp. ovata]